MNFESHGHIGALKDLSWSRVLTDSYQTYIGRWRMPVLQKGVRAFYVMFNKREAVFYQSITKYTKVYKV